MDKATKITDYGIWERYTPSEVPDSFKGHNVVFCRSQDTQEDFYDFIKGTEPTGHVYIMVDDLKKVVCSVADDGVDQYGFPHRHQIWPLGYRLIVAEGLPSKDYRGMIWDDLTFYAAPQEIPAVTRAQIKIALHRADLLSTVEEIVANGDPELVIWYSDTTHWDRKSPYVDQIIKALKDYGVSQEQFDDLFIEAAKIG